MGDSKVDELEEDWCGRLGDFLKVCNSKWRDLYPNWI